jgi:RNA polymerase sigma factor (sigma-70 family)
MSPRRPESERPQSTLHASDADLVARCAGGDELAWTTLVHRYRRLVYTIPYRMGLDPFDADEVFQITFMRLAERLDSLKDPSRVRAWLVTTARRIALNTVGRRRPVDESEDVLANVSDPGELPSDELERLERQQLIRIALERLGDRCRELLTHLYYPDEGGGSYEAVAEEMDIPIGSIGPTRMRCLKKLLVEFRRVSKE